MEDAVAGQPEFGSVAKKMARCGRRKMPVVQNYGDIFSKIIQTRNENCLTSRITNNRIIEKNCYRCRMKDAAISARTPDP